MKNSFLVLRSVATLVLLFCGLFLSTHAQAGTALLNGQAEARALPEFVSLNITVSSECYTSAAEASKANDMVASKVLSFLKAYANVSIGDEITATGGYVQRSTGYNPRTQQPVCINTFKKENHLTMKIFNLQNFAVTFTEIQDHIYSLGMNSSNQTIESPTDFLQMSAPTPELTPATLKTLERQALLLALQDAKEKFEVTMALAGVSKYHITRYSENQLITNEPSQKVGRTIDENASPAPVQFGSLSVSKMLYVEFSFTEAELNILPR